MSEKTYKGLKTIINETNDEEVNINGNKESDEKVICEIHFDNTQDRVYFAGQVVSGCVNLKLEETQTVTAIYAKIVGRGYCSWYTGGGRHRSHHMNEIFFMNKRINFVGTHISSLARERVIVQPGEYKYSFSCEIPDECITSVENNTGSIRYYVAVVIDEGCDKRKEFEEPFTVLSTLNLNHDVSFGYPLSDEIEKTYNTYCCLLCCWETEPVKITVRIPIRAFAPGQEIESTIVVDNKSNQTFSNFTAFIFKKIEFYADNRTNSSTDILAQADCDGCPAGESVSRKLRITVPPTPRTETSDICSIGYTLRIGAFADCCRDDPNIEFPITIGTYPIERINTQTNGIVVTQPPTMGTLDQNMRNQEQLNTKNFNEPTPSQPLLLEGNICSNSNTVPSTSSVNKSIFDPPQFQVGESNDSDKELNKSYRPMYPVYRSTQFPLRCNLQVEAINTMLEE